MNCDRLIQALKSYRCQHFRDVDDNGLSLVDVLTPNGDSDISRGLDELELLVDHISIQTTDKS